MLCLENNEYIDGEGKVYEWNGGGNRMKLKKNPSKSAKEILIIKKEVDDFFDNWKEEATKDNG